MPFDYLDTFLMAGSDIFYVMFMDIDLTVSCLQLLPICSLPN